MAPSAPHPPLLERLLDPTPLVTVEFRPPRAGVSSDESMDSWIDMQHEVGRLAGQGTLLFLTDNAVGESEEENLRHLTTNLAHEISPEQVIPFLTCKHSLEYCLMYAARAASSGYKALTVLGGDRAVGAPRCLPHAYVLRQRVRERVSELMLGGWANPHRDAAEQVDFLLRDAFTAEFYLTQIVSHHQLDAVEAFAGECARRGVTMPGVFGVFYYRSANPNTLARLGAFLPVPAEGVTRDFEAGRSAAEICATTIRRLRDIGVSRVYLSNLGVRGAVRRYREIQEAVAGA